MNTILPCSSIIENLSGLSIATDCYSKIDIFRRRRNIGAQKTMSILIIGGAGYIGSHVNRYLNSEGYSTIVADNLCRGRRQAVKWGIFLEGDLGDREFLNRLFSEHEIEAVMHFAAFAYVGESAIEPSIYYDNNVSKTLLLLDAMVRHRVKHFIFSSSCATFGNAEYTPIDEEHPQRPINPYGYTKLVVERILADYDRAYGLKHCILRYFNAVGADFDGEIGENHDPETHLIPLVLEVAAGRRKVINVFGDDYPTPDGTCIRDYIHVMDLAEAHLKGMEHIMNTDSSDHFNLGCGQGYSIREVLRAAEKITGTSVEVNYAKRRDGDPPKLVGASKKAEKILGWTPRYRLEDSLASAWNWTQRSLHSPDD